MWYAQLDQNNIAFAVTDFNDPPTNPNLIAVNGPEVLGKLYQNGQFINPPVPDTSNEELTRVLSLVNTKYAEWGTVWNNLPIRTDDGSQIKYLSELSAIQLGVREDNDLWEFGDFLLRPVSNEDFKAMATTARAYVRDCFGVKAYIKSLIDDHSITKVEQVEPFYTQVLSSLTVVVAQSMAKG